MTTAAVRLRPRARWVLDCSSPVGWPSSGPGCRVWAVLSFLRPCYLLPLGQGTVCAALGHL